MKARVTFKGGIHPPENKGLCGELSIKDFPPPETAVLPLQQSLGSASEPVVKKGDKVKKGTLIARSKGYISSNLHSSVSGEVIDIRKSPHPLLGEANAIIIKSDNRDEPERDYSAEEASADSLSSGEILELIQNAGIVGLGGATFPAHVKLNPPADKPIKTFIINGAECEPYLTSDHSLMLECADRILKGAALIKKMLKAEKCLIAIEENKKDAIALFRQKIIQLKNAEGLQVFPLKVKYPQGAEKQLIYTLTGKEVPSGGLPMDVSVLVHNIGTVFAVYEAVFLRKPLFERIVTVSGKGIKNPANWRVRIGTTFKMLVNHSGLADKKIKKLIMGGPMMGLAQYTDEVPVVKATSGILVLTSDEAADFEHLACIRCGKCVSVCPMGLMPAEISKMVEKGRIDTAKSIGLMDCMECGSCNYICPSGTNLLQYIKLGKYEYLRSKNVKR
ncbi:MAG: electron transport complex subunit RsxC [Candidatus Aureabacteria bacterium]|nr:electron transport complex subunit RsxC [Candidatus Auribacterota bacterium]